MDLKEPWSPVTFFDELDNVLKQKNLQENYYDPIDIVHLQPHTTTKDFVTGDLLWSENKSISENEEQVLFGINKDDNWLLSSAEANLFPLNNIELACTVVKEKGKPGRRTNFTVEDETQLAQLVKLHGEASWSLISSIMTKWNRKQLREHYINFVKCKSKSTDFSLAEDSAILMHVKEDGHTWKKLSNKLPGRSPIAIKNRYYKILMKRFNTSNVQENEVSRLSTRNDSTNDKITEGTKSVNKQIKSLNLKEQKIIEGILDNNLSNDKVNK